MLPDSSQCVTGPFLLPGTGKRKRIPVKKEDRPHAIAVTHSRCAFSLRRKESHAHKAMPVSAALALAGSLESAVISVNVQM